MAEWTLEAEDTHLITRHQRRRRQHEPEECFEQDEENVLAAGSGRTVQDILQENSMSQRENFVPRTSRRQQKVLRERAIDQENEYGRISRNQKYTQSVSPLAEQKHAGNNHAHHTIESPNTLRNKSLTGDLSGKERWTSSSQQLRDSEEPGRDEKTDQQSHDVTGMLKSRGRADRRFRRCRDNESVENSQMIERNENQLALAHLPDQSEERMAVPRARRVHRLRETLEEATVTHMNDLERKEPIHRGQVVRKLQDQPLGSASPELPLSFPGGSRVMDRFPRVQHASPEGNSTGCGHLSAHFQPVLDVVMWHNPQHSCLIFGLGFFLMSAASKLSQLKYSSLSAGANILLLYLAANFFRRACSGRPRPPLKAMSEESFLQMVRSILPLLTAGTGLLNHLFSGDPSTTLWTGMGLWAGGQLGSMMTLGSLARTAFVAAFVVPRLYVGYRSEIQRRAQQLAQELLARWAAWPHKRAGAAGLCLLAWHSSSVPTRLFGAFMAAVALRLYQQTHRQEVDAGVAYLRRHAARMSFSGSATLHQAMRSLTPDGQQD